MRETGPWQRVGVAVVILTALVAGTFAVLSQSSAQAQLPTDFTLSVSDGGLPPTGGSSDVVIAISPGESAIAAVGALVSYDETIVQPTGCVTLVGLGACSTETPGEVNVQTVDPGGWTSDTDLFRITFTSIALVDPTPLSVTVTSAYDVGGTLIVGEVGDGTIGPALNGDVDCDNIISIGDALMIAQYSVSTRTAATCPLAEPRTQIDITNADATGDGRIDIGDALRVAQCSVGLRDCQE